MNIIPVINCPDAASAGTKIAVLRTFLNDGDWVHLDVTDGIFSSHPTWNNPVAWKSLVAPFNFEVHLMSVHPEGKIGVWITAGARRIVVHVETLTFDSAEEITKMCAGSGVAVMLASNFETSVEAFDAYYGLFSEFQILAVPPGPGGQPFDENMLAKISALRASAGKNATIEVDGGINLETAKKVKEAGADVVVSGTYIFGNENPRRAYEELKEI